MAERQKGQKNAKTAYICDACRRADKEGATHPGVRHRPGICDCHPSKGEQT